MMDFIMLFDAIDQTTKTSGKVNAIVQYLEEATEEDKIFAIAILMGNKPKRPVKTTDLRAWAAEFSSIPLWLLEESYFIVGDLAETLMHVIPKSNQETAFHLVTIFQDIMRLQGADIGEQRSIIIDYWTRLNGTALFVFNKFLTGNFRVGVSRKLVIKAVAKYLNAEEPVIEHQLMGKWNPFEETLQTLFKVQTDKHFLPYPFYLAYPLESEPETLGNISDWIIEPKLDGIRGQLIIRQDELFVWSRGEDLMTDKFVEFNELTAILPNGIVLDGEVIPWKEEHPLDFSVMQTRIGRKNISKKSLQDAPLVMVCYDVLEWEGEDIRSWPLWKRREKLIELLQTYPVDHVLKLSVSKTFESWADAATFRREARHYHAEGLMLKHKDSPYEVGRKRGRWWKWKTDPMTVDGVLIYAQSGHGRRANLFTDYTFAVWDEGQLVPFTKAYSGLTDKELITIDNWIKRNTIEKFGPVRSVQPELVFELAFEGINRSSRHKSGIALRFPRIVRWRKDKPASEANTKEDLLQLISSVHESNS
ncbi:ATP-dependent DNA ligase [Sphingobacterium wenxiniae]|uniref:DNA ligase (ATP) n=1 Tax=Sphingobacterium wenxiniae TaxID=683125 RepID=A0A1I6NUK8_9SPHI|nr:ATP-dependent DNA ligase [Sphingobacterium wenxiniae]SFS31642.1 DNA ligase-1 [Sphingobacterium wenxiniae]